MIDISDKIIPVSFRKLDNADELYYLSSSHRLWIRIMTELWDSFVDQDDRPVILNEAQQLPMCRIYHHCIIPENYITLEKINEEEYLGRISFGNFDFIDVKYSLVWSRCDVKRILSILNSKLKLDDYEIVLENEEKDSD